MNTAALPLSSEALAHALHDFLQQTDPARRKQPTAVKIPGQLETCRDHLSSVLLQSSNRELPDDLVSAIGQTQALLEQEPPPLPGHSSQWRSYRKQLMDAYDSLSKSLVMLDIHVPELRPTNYARNLFHVGNAAVAISVLTLADNINIVRGAIFVFFAFAWTAETLRRFSPSVNAVLMKLLGVVAHPHEHHRVNSATWYTTSLMALALADVPIASLTALLVLGVSDPIAALVGRRYGTIKLVNGRSLQGSAAFWISGAIASFIALTLVGGLSTSAVVCTALGASFVGALAELFSRKLDDNLTVPLSVAATAWGILQLFGYTA